jgi:hypothetical protein
VGSVALIPIKTASVTGYCDCVHGCYELANFRDDETGKGYCPRCAREHLEMNRGVGIPQPAPMSVPDVDKPELKIDEPDVADPPARLR